jgi:hypothetical protein
MFSPNEYRYNPYTQKVNDLKENKMHSDKPGRWDVKDFIFDNMPDFVPILVTKAKLKEFMEDRRHNKIIFFSKKKKVPAVVKAVACAYRGRLRMAFVNEDTKPLVKEFEVGVIPQVVGVEVREGKRWERFGTGRTLTHMKGKIIFLINFRGGLQF